MKTGWKWIFIYLTSCFPWRTPQIWFHFGRQFSVEVLHFGSSFEREHWVPFILDSCQLFSSKHLWEVESLSPEQRAALFTAQYKRFGLLSSGFFSPEMGGVGRHPFGPICLAPKALGERTRNRHAGAHAPCCAVGNKVLSLCPRSLGLPPASIKLWQANLLACK